MYNSFELALKYLRYQITAANSRGHGTHSPFVYNFIEKVLNDRRSFYYFDPIEKRRLILEDSKEIVAVKDFGAGSVDGMQKNRQVGDVAKRSLKNKKYGQLLFRMVNYYRPHTIIELGTCLGITTSYLAAGSQQSKVFSFEGAESYTSLAKQQFNALGLSNIKQVLGNFDETLPGFLKNQPVIDFAFIDGNHREEPTYRYFEWLLPHLQNNSILVFDDIYWSPEMENVWTRIKAHKKVTCSIDLFFIGIILVSKDFKQKQDFKIRF